MDETFKMPNWHLEYGRGENVKYLLFAFTELGVAMLSSVLKSQWQSKSTAGSCGFSCRCAVALRMRRSTRPSLPRCNFVVFPICFYFRKVAFRVEAGCDAALYSLVDGTPQSFDTAFIFFQKPQFGADCLACDLGMFWRKCH